MTGAELQLFQQPIVWNRTGDPYYPYITMVDTTKWIVRVNDFPEEDMYTLIVDEVEIVHFNDWPQQWKRQ